MAGQNTTVTAIMGEAAQCAGAARRWLYGAVGRAGGQGAASPGASTGAVCPPAGPLAGGQLCASA